MSRPYMTIALIALLICATCGTISGVAIERAYAQDTGTVAYELVVSFNATAFGKDTPNTYIITISEDGLESEHNIPFKYLTKGITDEGLDPPIVSQKGYLFSNPSITSFSDIVLGDDGDTSVPILTESNASCAYISTYLNGTIKHTEYAADFALNFVIPDTHFPSIQKVVIFNSPYNYAVDYCYENDLTFDRITDIYLNQTTDYAAVSTLGNEYIGDKYGLYNMSVWDPDEQEYFGKPYAPTLKAIQPTAFGTLQSSDVKILPIIVGLIVAGLAVAVFCWLGMPEISKWVAESKLTEATMMEIQASKEVALAAINAEYNITMSMLAGKAVFEANVLNMLNNDTITYDQAMGLLGLTGVGYENMINQRATNIKQLAQDYYNHTEQIMGDYTDAMVAIATWSDWLNNLFILLIIVIIVLVVFKLFQRKSTPSTSIVVVPTTTAAK